MNQTTHYGWTPLADRHPEPPLQAGGLFCSITAPIPTSPTTAAGRRSIWPPTTAISKAAIIRSAMPDMDHLEYIKLLLDKGANVNARICGTASTPTECDGDSTETRTNFTMQWLYRRRRDALPARRAVRRCEADEVPARPRRRSEDQDRPGRHGAGRRPPESAGWKA